MLGTRLLKRLSNWERGSIILVRLQVRNFFSSCEDGICCLLYAQPHPEDIIPDTTQKASNVTSGVSTLSSSGEGAYSIPDEYSRDA
jgi:hypothetical protein